MTVETISQQLSTKEYCRTGWDRNHDLLSDVPDNQSDVHPTEPSRPALLSVKA